MGAVSRVILTIYLLPLWVTAQPSNLSSVCSKISIPQDGIQISEESKTQILNRLRTFIPAPILPTAVRLIETESAFRGSSEARFCPDLQPSNQELVLLVAPGFRDVESHSLAIIAHEVFHSAVWRSGLTIPKWLDEGLALHVQSEFSPQSVNSVIQEHLLVSPHQRMNFEASEIVSNSPSFSYSVYGHALLFVRQLQRNSKSSLSRMLLERSLAGNLHGIEALEEILKAKLEDLFVDFSVAKFVNQFNYQEPLSREFQPNVVAEGFRTKRDKQASCDGEIVSCLLQSPVPISPEAKESMLAYQIDGNGGVFRCASPEKCDPALGQVYLLFTRAQF